MRRRFSKPISKARVEVTTPPKVHRAPQRGLLLFWRRRTRARHFAVHATKKELMINHDATALAAVKGRQAGSASKTAMTV
jgi:hypothetical protein